MAAYVINVQVTDPVAYEEYKRLTPGSLVPVGGLFVVRGGAKALRQASARTEMVLVEGV